MSAVLAPTLISRPAIIALAEDLRLLLGGRNVTAEWHALEKASTDQSVISPIIRAQLPLGIAELVAFPSSAAQIQQAVQAAVRHRVPITTRGKGTGNYGQAIPMDGGVVLDTSRAKRVLEVGDGWVTAEAGARMIVLESAARQTGQQLWLYPSTAQSTLGGFLSGGSGGTGSIKHGVNWDGFVTALDVVHADPDATVVHVEGEQAQPYVHTYGVVGVISTATVRLEPLQDWRGVYYSFPTFAQAISVVREIGRLHPTPRLVSADTVEVSATLPSDEAVPAGRSSLRAILDAATVSDASELVRAAGGTVEAVREGLSIGMKLSMLSYNHPTWWLMQAYPDRYFHIEVSGDALVDRIDEVHAVYPGGMLHLEAAGSAPLGMLNGLYESPDQVYAGIEKLRAMGVFVHDPHQWYVDREVARVRDLAARTDPLGLLNPGKFKPGDAPVPFTPPVGSLLHS